MGKKKKDVLWDFPDESSFTYVGAQMNAPQIYVGGKYYSDVAQIHLSLEEAKWLRKTLLLAIRRFE